MRADTRCKVLKVDLVGAQVDRSELRRPLMSILLEHMAKGVYVPD